MNEVEYITTFVKGITFGATLVLALMMFLESNVKGNSKWRKGMLRFTGIAMITHTLTLTYRLLIDVTGYYMEPYFIDGAIMLDLLCIPPLAVIEVMLTRHTTLSIKSILALYSPFLLIEAIHFVFGIEMIKDVALIFTGIACTIFAIITYRDMRAFNKVLRQTYSDVEGLDLKWLSRILLLLVFALSIWLLSTILATHITKAIYRLTIISVWIVLCTRLQRQKEATEVEDLTPVGGGMFSSIRTTVNGIDPKAFLVGRKLDELMHDKQLFRQNDINIGELATELNCNKNLIAQYFASKSTSMHTYINGLRLNYAAEQLLMTSDPTMEIAKRAGYKFDSVFFRAFQDMFGCTPQEYRSKYKDIK